jgi:hypothetical protein
MSPNLAEQIPNPDGRQSDVARAIARGTQRCLLARGFVSLPEVTLPNGRRADLFALGPSDVLWIVEIKSSIADYKSDEKWNEYRDFCDCFSFAVAPDFPREILPQATGLIVADRYDGDVLRNSEKIQLQPARRRALVSSFARVAATRLLLTCDPDAQIKNRELSM